MLLFPFSSGFDANGHRLCLLSSIMFSSIIRIEISQPIGWLRRVPGVSIRLAVLKLFNVTEQGRQLTG